jgi:hypothetical protein
MERSQFTREFKLEAVRRRQKTLGFIRPNCAIG